MWPSRLNGIVNQTDTATGESGDDRALSELSAEDARRFEVDQALQRIMDGACGIGELTDRRIPAARLRAVPWTRFSATSETELERNGAMRRPGLGVLWSVRKVANGVVERSRVAPEPNVIRPLGAGPNAGAQVADVRKEHFVPPMNLADLRTDYRRGKLEREDLDVDPIGQFNAWMKEACDFGIIEPTAMSLATVGTDGRPLLRTVLLKGVDARGFVFFTNLDSRKARQLAQNPNAALMFPWLALERQVVITGQANRLSTAESLRYFLTRPRDSQLSAWASPQSSIISSRKVPRWSGSI